VCATEELARAFGIAVGDPVTHIVTRAAEDRRPISISDAYQPIGILDVGDATELEETVADRLPIASHAEWLRTTPGDLVKTVHQRYFAADGRLLMLSDTSYPQGRYDGFRFRMTLRP
jgi:GntR family transcriptional regulator